MPRLSSTPTACSTGRSTIDFAPNSCTIHPNGSLSTSRSGTRCTRCGLRRSFGGCGWTSSSHETTGSLGATGTSSYCAGRQALEELLGKEIGGRCADVEESALASIAVETAIGEPREDVLFERARTVRGQPIDHRLREQVDPGI